MNDWKGDRQKLNPKKNSPAKPNLHVELDNLREDPGEATDRSADRPDMVARVEAITCEQHSNSELFPMPAVDQH